MPTLSAVTFVGQNLVRPECVLATAAGDLYAGDWRGGIAHIKPDGSRRSTRARPPTSRGPAPQRHRARGRRQLPVRQSRYRCRRRLAHRPRRPGAPRADRAGPRPGPAHELRHARCQGPPLADGLDARKAARRRFFAQREHRLHRAGRRPRRSHRRGRPGVHQRVLRLARRRPPLRHRDLRPPAVALSAQAEWRSRPEGGRRHALPEGYPDGFAFDAEGCCWIACVVSNQLVRVDRDGTAEVVLEDKEAPTSQPSSAPSRAKHASARTSTATPPRRCATSPTSPSAAPICARSTWAASAGRPSPSCRAPSPATRPCIAVWRLTITFIHSTGTMRSF